MGESSNVLLLSDIKSSQAVQRVTFVVTFGSPDRAASFFLFCPNRYTHTFFSIPKILIFLSFSIYIIFHTDVILNIS